MKYLKTFESLTYKQILENIKDILLPISDMGYDINARLIKDYNYHIFVNIVDYKQYSTIYEIGPLNFTKEIEEEFDRLYEFGIENGFKVDKIYYKYIQPDGRVFNFHSREVSYSYDDFKKEAIGKKLAYLSFDMKQVPGGY